MILLIGRVGEYINYGKFWRILQRRKEEEEKRLS